MNKRGFTLIELLVYMAIVGIIVVVAGQAFSDSTKFRVRTQNMLKANEVAETIGNLLRDDIAQMGAKSAAERNADIGESDEIKLRDSAYMHVEVDPATGTADSSSFEISDTGMLKIRRMSYTSTGVFKSVEEVTWYLDGNVLYRSCKTLDGIEDEELCPKDEANTVEIADNIESFVIQAAKPGAFSTDHLLFPYYSTDLTNKKFRFISYFGSDNYVRINTTPVAGETSVSLTGFSTNYTGTSGLSENPIKHMIFLADAGETSDSWKLNCHSFTFKKDSIYEISFEMEQNGDEARLFRPGVDHMALGIRKINELTPMPVADVDDYLFYPPSAINGGDARVMRFSTHEADVDACVAFTFAFFSPTVNLGNFIINNVKVRRVPGVTYEFEEGFVPTMEQKKDVRAVKIKLVVKQGGNLKFEKGMSEVVIPIPSNGVER